MDTLQELLKLPYQTLAILIAGYMSYRLAYTGRDSTHKTIDTAAIILAFAFIAQAASAWLLVFSEKLGWDTSTLWAGYLASILGMVISLISAAFWRYVSAEILGELLKTLHISWSDRYVEAWQSVIVDEKSGPTMITVKKKNGDRLMCDKLSEFSSERFGPMIQGQDGSVALFVTHVKPMGSKDWEEVDDVKLDDWGPELTIIPADEIAEIQMRHSPEIRKGLWKSLFSWRG